MSELPAPEPPVSPETLRFWSATTEQRLLLQRCSACAAIIWFPRSFCPECWSVALEEFDATGRGTIYSLTVVHRGQGAYADAAPYVVAYVELDEGPRLLTNIVGTDPAALRIGMPVRAVFDPTGGASALIRFTVS